MRSKNIRKAISYEKRKASEHNAKHIGGPGKPDYQRGNVIGEVKCRVSKVTKPELMRLVHDKGINQVDSKSGFTKPALKYAQQYQPNLKLIERKKVVKPRRKRN